MNIKNLVVLQDIPDVDQPGVVPGYLMEILRKDDEVFRKFGQSTMSVAHKGMIKGFHVHAKQDDLWFVATGKVIIVLHDLRPNSPTFGKTDTMYAGKDDYKLVLIPTGVAHGYKVLSDEPVILFYHTTEAYNAQQPDEKVIPHDDPKINFHWTEYE